MKCFNSVEYMHMLGIVLTSQQYMYIKDSNIVECKVSSLCMMHTNDMFIHMLVIVLTLQQCMYMKGYNIVKCMHKQGIVLAFVQFVYMKALFNIIEHIHNQEVLTF